MADVKLRDLEGILPRLLQGGQLVAADLQNFTQLLLGSDIAIGILTHRSYLLYRNTGGHEAARG